jgi:hypothetical protein
MQAPIAVASALLEAAAWWTTGHPLWTVGAVIIIANWALHLIAIMPTNRRLEATPSGGDADTRGPLVRWGQLHVVRSILGAVATVVYQRPRGGSETHEWLTLPRCAPCYRATLSRCHFLHRKPGVGDEALCVGLALPPDYARTPRVKPGKKVPPRSRTDRCHLAGPRASSLASALGQGPRRGRL